MTSSNSFFPSSEISEDFISCQVFRWSAANFRVHQRVIPIMLGRPPTFDLRVQSHHRRGLFIPGTIGVEAAMDLVTFIQEALQPERVRSRAGCGNAAIF